MQRVSFDLGFKPDDNILLKKNEDKLKFISPYDKDNRTTYIEYNTVPVIKYKIFDAYPELVTGFSTRFGGVSKEHLASLNLSFTRGDDEDNVIENHKRFAEAVGYDYAKTVFSDQVHKTDIHIIDSYEDVGKGIVKKSDIKEIDGLITALSNIPIMTFYADCVPLYMYDSVNHVIGLAHSGWKGTVAGIGAVMVEKMAANYGTKADDIICAIGPSICRDCYEVDDVVYDRLADRFTGYEIGSMITKKGEGKYQLDLHKACLINFINAGVPREHIALSDLCTCCNSNVLYSHRASKGMRGNLAAVMMLKD